MVWCGIFSTWQSLGNRASKAQFINQKNLKKFEVSCTSRNTQKKISEIPETTQIRGRERAHLTSAWPGLAQRCLGRARPGFSSEFFLMSSWCGLGSSLMSSSLMGRAQPGFFFFFSILCSSLMWVFITVINRVLETRFSCSCHVEKMPHQTWLGHGNRVFETRFID